MADHRTTVTELITGLGMLGFDDVEGALAARPAEMVNVSPEGWADLAELHRGGAYAPEFAVAWDNGVAFLRARDGLRDRLPLQVEWRGGARQPGDEPVPADLRVDHVFLVSCKYLSRIVTNSSPAAVFDRLLAGGHGGRAGDWYAEVAPEAYQDLYRAVLDHLDDLDRGPGQERLPDVGSGGPETPDGPAAAGVPGFPAHVSDLEPGQRAGLHRALGRGRWPEPLRPAAAAFADAVARESAGRWREALAGADRERVLWRLLRIGSAPYYVLGAAPGDPLRLRIGTAWDWRQHHRLTGFEVTAEPRAQPVVAWRAEVEHRRSRRTSVVEGHVEIRWSHGKFAQPPEAKVYLDTSHDRVPGYWPLA